MDGEDFSMPSPKRQRTNSPHEESNTTAAGTAVGSELPSQSAISQTPAKKSDAKLDMPHNDENEILDALMQQIESETTSAPSHATEIISPSVASEVPTVQTAMNDKAMNNETDADESNEIHTNGGVCVDTGPTSTTAEHSQADNRHVEELAALSGSENMEQREISPHVPTEAERPALQVDGIPATEAIEPVEGAGDPEWEVDSSPYESSSDTDSSTSEEDSDDEDEDADGDYAMLDPEEAARILMQGDAGSDDEGDKSKHKGEASGLRTANEQLEYILPIPDVTITEDTKIEELGHVEAVIENNVLIKGKVSGEYQVLESGSLLCLANRAIAGVVCETLGRVEQPLYTVRLPNGQEIEKRGISEKGTIVYYVPQHSSFVFTQPLKAFKGSDASNFHDEEVGDDEMEFSDDEAEAEHKRQLKLKRQGRLGEAGKGRGSNKGGRGGQRGGYKPSPLSTDTNGSAYGNGSLEMNYDDVEEGEEGYTPLARPNNFQEMVYSSQSTEASNPSYMPPPPFSDRDRGRGRGHHRGGRGQDRGGRGGRGGRGNYRGNHGHSDDRSNAYTPNSPNHMQYPNAFHQGQFAFSQPPSAPLLTPQNAAFPYNTITSPISPLPKQQFNFGAGYPAPQTLSPTFQGQLQWGQQMPPGFTPQFNNNAIMQFAQQFHQAQQQQQQQQQNNNNNNNGWQVNQAAAAEVQRQLEEMRRAQQGGPQ